ncbi:hypothetical protein BJF79_12300 [Actinomadura sp. CNU-125]|nr:hypothetical protein BJF79_12300 [Actinomadura sp. CNU-125]
MPPRRNRPTQPSSSAARSSRPARARSASASIQVVRPSRPPQRARASSSARCRPTPSASNSRGTSASRNGSSASPDGSATCVQPTTKPSDTGASAPADRVSVADMCHSDTMRPQSSETRMRSAIRRPTSARHAAGARR